VPQVRLLNLGLGATLFCVGFAMPAGLKRYYGKGHLHFMTFSCYRRLPLQLRLAKYGVALVDGKCGSRAATLQSATSEYYAGLSRKSTAQECIRRGGGKNA
jgi:hypothetical protein